MEIKEIVIGLHIIIKIQFDEEPIFNLNSF